jgi:predicted trehalose synthase
LCITKEHTYIGGIAMATISTPSPDRIEKVVEPYAREVGKLVASWNTLHERLGELFSAVLSKGHPGIGSAIWYSTQNDRAQREMLRAATEAAAAEGTVTQQARDEIKWLLDRTNELANERNMQSMRR